MLLKGLFKVRFFPFLSQIVPDFSSIITQYFPDFHYQHHQNIKRRSSGGRSLESLLLLSDSPCFLMLCYIYMQFQMIGNQK